MKTFTFNKPDQKELKEYAKTEDGSSQQRMISEWVKNTLSTPAPSHSTQRSNTVDEHKKMMEMFSSF